MSYYTYNGTSGPDEIDTQDIADSLTYYTDGIVLNGNDGDDSLTATIVGEARFDEITGGAGDDWLSAYSIGSTFAFVNLYGDEGTDIAYLPFAVNTYTKEGPGIQFEGTSNDGSPISVLVGYDTEIVTDRDGRYYLVEDLYNDRNRAVTWSEAYARSYNGNEDWYLRNLDTYTPYHSTSSGSASTTTSSSGNIHELPFGSSGKWKKYKKTTGKDLLWGFEKRKKNGKKQQYAWVDNDVQEIEVFNPDTDTLRLAGNWENYKIQPYLGNTVFSIGNNIVATVNVDYDRAMAGLNLESY
jgi:hypothetical protein